MEKKRVTTLILVLVTLLFLIENAISIPIEALFSGGNGTIDNPFIISDCQKLQNIGIAIQEDFFYYYYRLSNNINCSETRTWDLNQTTGVYQGFLPIGDNSTPFWGFIDGQGYNITGLYINRNHSDLVGLFGNVKNSTIKNIGLIESEVTGRNYVGGLIGKIENSELTNLYSEVNLIGQNYSGGLIGYSNNTFINISESKGTITAKKATGGLIGFAQLGKVYNSKFTGQVYGLENVGGLIGHIEGQIVISSFSISNTSATLSNVGGLIGIAKNSSLIQYTYSISNVSGESNIGGLIGISQQYSFISHSFSKGEVTGKSTIGGLVGLNSLFSSILTCYSHANATGESRVGGLIGRIEYNASLSEAYSKGKVTGSFRATQIGGLIGSNTSDTYVTNSFFDNQTSNQTISAGGIGKNTSEMKKMTTYTNWDFSLGWGICRIFNEGYPYLLWEGYNEEDCPTTDPEALWTTLELSPINELPLGAYAKLFIKDLRVRGDTQIEYKIYNKATSQVAWNGIIIVTTNIVQQVDEMIDRNFSIWKPESEGEYFFNATINGVTYTSNTLKVVNKPIKKDTKVEIKGVKCAENITLGSTRQINLSVRDSNFPIRNITLTIQNTTYFLKKDNLSVTHRFLRDGNVNIKAEITNENNDTEKDTINIVVINTTVSTSRKYYVAACFDEQTIRIVPSRNKEVLINASGTRAWIKNASGIFELPKSNITFYWRFSDTDSIYKARGTSESAYIIYKIFSGVGESWVNLEVRAG